MSARPWYAWFPADYRAKTAHLSFAEDAAYRRMLDAYYERRAPLPAQPEALYRLCGTQTDEERAAVLSVAGQFFTNGDGLLKHARCDEQIARESRLIDEWREAGKRGAAKRWGRDRVGHRVAHPDPNGVAIASYPQPQPQINHLSGKRQRKKTSLSPVPDPFMISPEMLEWATRNGIPEPAVRRESAQFADHARANARECADWVAAWRNWMRRAKDRQPSR